jgi:hypothetical protein
MATKIYGNPFTLKRVNIDAHEPVPSAAAGEVWLTAMIPKRGGSKRCLLGRARINETETCENSFYGLTPHD